MAPEWQECTLRTGISWNYSNCSCSNTQSRSSAPVNPMYTGQVGSTVFFLFFQDDTLRMSGWLRYGIGGSQLKFYPYKRGEGRGQK